MKGHSNTHGTVEKLIMRWHSVCVNWNATVAIMFEPVACSMSLYYFVFYCTANVYATQECVYVCACVSHTL